MLFARVKMSCYFTGVYVIMPNVKDVIMKMVLLLFSKVRGLAYGCTYMSVYG